jgi:hypothetical protein
LCPSVCGSVYLSVSTITPLRKLLQSLFWCQNLRNFSVVNWKAFGLCSVKETWHASPKRHSFKGFFLFFSIFTLLITFKWFDMSTNSVGLSNTRRMMPHMLGVNQSVTPQVTSEGLKCLFLTVFHKILTFDDNQVDWHGSKLCRSCQNASNYASHLWGQSISDTTSDVRRVRLTWKQDLKLINKSYQVNLLVAFLNRFKWSYF